MQKLPIAQNYKNYFSLYSPNNLKYTIPMKKSLILILIISIFLSACTQHATEKDQPYLIMVSLDGFRWDYTDSVASPSFDAIEKMGVKAESMQVSFPSKTFPNHYTLVTGLVPDHHGIVNNSFFAPNYNEVYSLGNRKAVENGKFYDGEPIWNTAEKQGMKAASYFWVGSEANIQDMHPSIWKKYDHHFDFYQRVDSVISWLSLEEENRPHMITWYVHEPDGVGHGFGPHSHQADSVIIELDKLLAYFMKKLEAHPLAGKVNVIVTADHGMGPTSASKTININEIVKSHWAEHIVGGNPIYNIQAKPGFKDSIYMALSKVDGLKIYENPNLPEHLNYGTNPRCLDFTVVADSGWCIIKRKPKMNYPNGGTHGYDIHNKDMNAIFYAYGPAFKKGYQQEMFKNVSVYPLICEILDLVPAKNDGNLKEVQGMLVSDKE